MRQAVKDVTYFGLNLLESLVIHQQTSNARPDWQGIECVGQEREEWMKIRRVPWRNYASNEMGEREETEETR